MVNGEERNYCSALSGVGNRLVDRDCLFGTMVVVLRLFVWLLDNSDGWSSCSPKMAMSRVDMSCCLDNRRDTFFLLVDKIVNKIRFFC